jgi:hypothetical protein
METAAKSCIVARFLRPSFAPACIAALLQDANWMIGLGISSTGT